MKRVEVFGVPLPSAGKENIKNLFSSSHVVLQDQCVPQSFILMRGGAKTVVTLIATKNHLPQGGDRAKATVTLITNKKSLTEKTTGESYGHTHCNLKIFLRKVKSKVQRLEGSLFSLRITIAFWLLKISSSDNLAFRRYEKQNIVSES